MTNAHDGMAPFELYQPVNLDDALALTGRLGTDGWLLAGGMDSLERFKDRIKRPKAVIDLSRVETLRGVRKEGEGLAIGAMTTLTEVARHPEVLQRFGLLAQAAGEVASPQIRNQGTLGGNVAQDTRCWYYRGGWTCYRAGGNICYADTPEGMNREHAIFGADRCAAVSPSDTAPALVALEASFVLRSAGGTRVLPAQEFFCGPGHDITRLNVLAPGEVLSEIRLPGTWAGASFHFEKVRDRPVWDFPLANMAAALRLSGERIVQARLVLGAVAAVPWRLTAVETMAAGKTREAAAKAADRLTAAGAVPLTHNAYKLALVRNLVKRALRGPKPGKEAA